MAGDSTHDVAIASRSRCFSAPPLSSGIAAETQVARAATLTCRVSDGLKRWMQVGQACMADGDLDERRCEPAEPMPGVAEPVPGAAEPMVRAVLICASARTNVGRAAGQLHTKIAVNGPHAVTCEAFFKGLMAELWMRASGELPQQPSLFEAGTGQQQHQHQATTPYAIPCSRCRWMEHGSGPVVSAASSPGYPSSTSTASGCL